MVPVRKPDDFMRDALSLGVTSCECLIKTGLAGAPRDNFLGLFGVSARNRSHQNRKHGECLTNRKSRDGLSQASLYFTDSRLYCNYGAFLNQRLVVVGATTQVWFVSHAFKNANVANYYYGSVCCVQHT